MSYNISNFKILKIDAWMDAKDIIDLVENHEDDLCEINFLCGLRKKATDLLLKDTSLSLKINDIYWQGEVSGWSFDFYIKNVLPRIKGYVEAVVVWEGGQTFEGLIVKDGVVTRCDVEFKLKEK